MPNEFDARTQPGLKEKQRGKREKILNEGASFPLR